ncbi:MAG: four helix bundle protein [Clostridia bacterium]|nr:four helix bundle protein [Clostridia bacterium]
MVWQKSVQFVTDIYRITAKFPETEIYGLISQMRRCAVSVPSNIAEGYGRKTPADFLRFLQIAMGSLFELQTQMEVALNLRYIDRKQSESLYEKSREIERMLSSLIRKVREKNETS